MSKCTPRQLVIRMAILLVISGAGIHVALAQSQGGVILWNKLGSIDEVVNPPIGTPPTIEGNVNFVPGVFGNAYAAVGHWYLGNRIIIPADGLQLNPEAGTVEAWVMYPKDPIVQDYTYSMFSMLDGAYQCGYDTSLGCQVYYFMGDGVTGDLYTLYAIVVFSDTPGEYVQISIPGMDSVFFPGEWHHLALVWDRTGIGGSAECFRVYIDGDVYGASTANTWGAVPDVGNRHTVGKGEGTHDGTPAFAIDNLIVWDYAKTDFSDRFCESPLNEPPVCDANGPYSKECQGAMTCMQLDGSGSYDPDPGDTITYLWSSDCPGAAFQPCNTVESPILTLTSGGSCLIDCNVYLTVTDNHGASDSCSAPVTVQDTTPPEVTCPDDLTVECDGACNLAERDAWEAGFTATDLCGDVEPVTICSLLPGCGATYIYECDLTAWDECDNMAECSATFTVEDTTPPEITCPPDVTVTCPEPTDPNATGWATATDICDDDPEVIVYLDMYTQVSCLADPVMYRIDRIWRATDECGNFSQCVQTITVMRVVLDLDIKPGSCPNSYNRNSRGVLPVGLLGTPDFDVTRVDLSTVRLLRADCWPIGASVAPHEGPPGPHSVYADVGTPFPGQPCDCHELEGDGIVDLSMKFRTEDVVEMLELDDFDPGALVELVVIGELDNGWCHPYQFIATDCVRLVPPGTPPGILLVQASVPEAWIGASPLDNTLDGGGFADFERTYPQGTLTTLTASLRVEDATGATWFFSGWQLNGVVQNPVNRTIEISVLDEVTTLTATYRSASVPLAPVRKVVLP